MQIVIKIPEKMYDDCKVRNTGHYSLYDFSSLIANGTPLPKGHGRLIDAKGLKTTMTCYMMDKNKTHEAKYVMSVAKGIVDLQKAIIEADKEVI